MYRLHPWKFFKTQQIKPRATLSELNTEPALGMKLEWRLPEAVFTWINLCFCDSSVCHEVRRYSGSRKQELKYLCLIWNQTRWKQPRWLCRKQSVRKAQWRQKGTSIMQVLGFLHRVSQCLICTRMNCPKVCPRGVTCLQFAVCWELHRATPRSWSWDDPGNLKESPLAPVLHLCCWPLNSLCSQSERDPEDGCKGSQRTA